MRIRNFALLLLLAVLTGLYIGHQATDGVTADRVELQSSYKDLPPCAEEDSRGPCYWDAGSSGNGSGYSFWVDAHQRVHYLGVFRSFSYYWQPVTPALADALAESGYHNADSRVWENCAVRIAVGHNRKAPLVCPDGFVIPNIGNGG